MLETHERLTVTDLKQLDYCPRVVYYEQCLPHIRPRTYKMDAGHEAHQIEQRRAARRTLHAYGETSGRREFDVRLESASLGIVGMMDEVVFTEDGRVFPVDYKLAKAVRANYKLQLAAYALLLEEAYGVAVEAGYLVLIRAKQVEKVAISTRLRNSVKKRITQAQTMIREERMPPPTSRRNRCMDCEFRRFCNDI